MCSKRYVGPSLPVAVCCTPSVNVFAIPCGEVEHDLLRDLLEIRIAEPIKALDTLCALSCAPTAL
jgi:hypothetical protein